jgi:hypothetical protein
MTSDWITGKPVEALLGIFSSSLAIGSAGGLLLLLGVPFIHQVKDRNLLSTNRVESSKNSMVE